MARELTRRGKFLGTLAGAVILLLAGAAIWNALQPSEEEIKATEFVEQCRESIQTQRPGAEVESSFKPVPEVLDGGTRYKLKGEGTLNGDTFAWECNGGWNRSAPDKVTAYASIDIS